MTARLLLLAAALLAIPLTAQAQTDRSFGWVIENPGVARHDRAARQRGTGSIANPATWHVPFRYHQPVLSAPALPPRVQTAPPVTHFSSQTIIYGGGGGGYRGGYGAGYFPRGNGFPGGQREYRGGWLMPHDFNISGGPVVRDRHGFRVYGGGGYRGRRW